MVPRFSHVVSFSLSYFLHISPVTWHSNITNWLILIKTPKSSINNSTTQSTSIIINYSFFILYQVEFVHRINIFVHIVFMSDTMLYILIDSFDLLIFLIKYNLSRNNLNFFYYYFYLSQKLHHFYILKIYF